MKNIATFLIFLVFSLLVCTRSLPISNQDDFICDGTGQYNYKENTEYKYEYKSDTLLWINDISDEAKSNLELRSTVFIKRIKPCTYILKLKDSSISGETIISSQNSLKLLNELSAIFRINSHGELDSNIQFSSDDKTWSRNIKRSIISAFQTRFEKNLRSFDLKNKSDAQKSSVFYENDVLGRCRTTYSLIESKSDGFSKLNKKKSLHSCSLIENKTSAIQFVPYKRVTEFYHGKLFVENFNCQINLKDNILNECICEETSTYKIGSRGEYGSQAVAKSYLKFLTSQSSKNEEINFSNYEHRDISYEFDEMVDQEIETINLDSFVKTLCEAENKGLEHKHSANFRLFVNELKKLSKDELINFYETSKSRCSVAGLTVSQALVFADTDNSFEAVLALLDKDAYSDHVYITEFPILTALARNQNPSLKLLKNFKSYLEKKPSNFKYLNKLNLVYSALVKTYCRVNDCKDLNDEFSSIFMNNLDKNCANPEKKDIIISSLKAIGNIGFLKSTQVLDKCALNPDNSLEIRVDAIQALRNFNCLALEEIDYPYKILKDSNQDAELRINSFLILIRCSEGAKFQNFVKNEFSKWFEQESDIQVKTYIIDYAKEHGLTLLLNSILFSPKSRENFAVNFKELSWNNYLYKYSVLRDGALELETSVIYTTKTHIPRSVRFNMTLNLFGMSINFLDVTVRVEGMDDILKSLIVDKLTSEKLLKKIMEKPEQLLDILKVVAAKLKYITEKPFVSISIRLYGVDIFYSQLDEMNELRKFRELFNNPKELFLYGNLQTIKNILLFDTKVRKPLFNGLEFSTYMDTSIGLFASKKGSKEIVSEKLNFNMNNLYSISLSIHKRFDVILNTESKLSLLKKSFLNTKLKLNINGYKKNGTALYNLNITPEKSIPLLVFDGSFYKLNKNSYKEIKEFKIQKYEKKNCTSANFKSSVGLDICYSIERPVLGNILELINPIDLDRIKFEDEIRKFRKNLKDDDDDDDNDDDDDDENNGLDNSDRSKYKNKRPRITLAGPYHYEISLNNPDLINKLTFMAKLNREEESLQFEANLESTAENVATKRLELIYSRKRSETSREYLRKFDLELKNSQTNDIRLKINGDLVYRKEERIIFAFLLDNKILREFKFLFNATREKDLNKLVPYYKIEALVDSKITNNPKSHHFFFDLVPTENEIKSDFYMESSNSKTNYEQLRIFDGILSMTKIDDKNRYNIDLNLETFTKKQIHLYGVIFGEQLSSNIELSLKYSSPSFSFPSPASIKLGHAIDASSGGKSHVELHFNIPYTKVNHGLKFIFELEELKISYVEIQFSTPNNLESPFIVYIGKHVRNEEQMERIEYVAGIKNFDIQLSNNSSFISNSLKKVDDDIALKSISFDMVRILNKEFNRYELLIDFKKNNVKFISLEFEAHGNLNAIKSNNEELSMQNLGADLKVKVFEYLGNSNAYFNIETSKKNRNHNYEFEFKAENIIKILLKINKISGKLSLKDQTLDASYEISKEGEMKNLMLKSISNIRAKDQHKEFDVSYEKKLADGQVKKSNGVFKYKWENFKNFDASLNVPSHFDFKLKLENNLNSNNLNLSYSHLDFEPSKREIYFLAVDDVNKKIITYQDKQAEPSEFYNKQKMQHLVDYSYKKLSTEKDSTTTGNLELRYKKFRINIQSDFKFYESSLETSSEGNFASEFPALITDFGKPKKLTEKFIYSKTPTESSLKYNFETDSKLFGRFVEFVDLAFTRKKKENVNSKLSIDYRLANQTQTKKLFLDLHTDCAFEDFKCTFAKVNLKQQIRPEYNSRFVSGLSFDISECSLETKLERDIDSKNDFSVGSNLILSCKDKQVTNSTLAISRREKKLLIDLSTKSDLLYDRKVFKINYERPNSKNGLIELNIERNKEDSFSHQFSYNRQLDQTTQKLTKGNYIYKLSFGSAVKECEIKIESSNNYYNALKCKLKTKNIPIEMNYGYNLKVENPKESIFGKKNILLDLNLPERTLRLDYKRFYATPIDTSDDDNDQDNEREFNSTTNLFWDFLNDKKKMLTISAKRDNFAIGKTRFSIDVTNHPYFKLIRFELMRERQFNQTNLNFAASYELEKGGKNKLELTTMMSSDIDTNSFSVALDIDRPSFDVSYTNKFNKNTGRLEYLNIKLGKLVQLIVDKEFDPANRRISFELSNPNEKKYKLEAKSNLIKNYFITEGQLFEGNQQLSSFKSSFDSSNNMLDVEIRSIKSNNLYKLNFGIYNESLANAIITNESKNKILAIGTVRVKYGEESNELELNLNWNRFWNNMKKDILGLEQDKSEQNKNFNSFFGDAYSVVAEELKSANEYGKVERSAIANDFKKFFFLQVNFYLHAYPQAKEMLPNMLSKLEASNTPSSFWARYNNLATSINSLHIKLRKNSRDLSKYIPRLPIFKYNNDDNKNKEYDNNLIISRPTNYANNLYQFNAEYRDYLRKVGENILSFKANLIRDYNVINSKSLINKYKYRSLTDFKLVAHVYNRRNIIGFDGESRILQARCKYLLAHDISKNKFSVILNYNDSPYVLSFYAEGQGSIDINYDKAFNKGQQISLPFKVDLKEQGYIYVKRAHNGVCLTYNKDLSICCYEDSKSCSVALTRWFSGRVNGLLGKADNIVQNLEETDWYLESSCSFPNLPLKKPSEETVKMCYSIFGKHKESPFINSFQVVKPEGWQKICESILRADPKAKCNLMKAFVNHARIESVDSTIPNECYSCVNKKSSYSIEQLNQNEIEKGSDFVFLLLPCDRDKYSLDFTKLAKVFGLKDNNKYYAVKVNPEGASIYQSDNGETTNFDLKKAHQSISDQSTKEEIEKVNFINGLFLAGSLFTSRIAENRHLIIRSCGNCPSYSLMSALKLSKILSQRNITVSSWGDYNIVDTDANSENNQDTPIGYGPANIFLYNKSTKTIDYDIVENYKIEHEGDLCHRLAVKTNGHVFNINHLKTLDLIEQIPKWFEESPKYQTNLPMKCSKYDTPFGTLVDFDYTK